MDKLLTTCWQIVTINFKEFCNLAEKNLHEIVTISGVLVSITKVTRLGYLQAHNLDTLSVIDVAKPVNFFTRFTIQNWFNALTDEP